jgi:hypothetical protein
MVMLQNLIIRPAKPEDINFVMSSWKRTWRTSPWAGTVRNDEYFASINSTIEGLIIRGAQILVAELNNRLLGFICYEVLAESECCVHYLFVKDPFIRFNIAGELLNAAPGTKPGFYTHRYHQVAEVCTGWRHAPEIARRK